MDPVRLALFYELGHRAGLGHDLSPLSDDGLYQKILFLDHRGVEHPKFGHSVALRAMDSAQSAPSKHRRRPPRAAGKLFCFELALPKDSVSEDLQHALGQSGDDADREAGAASAVEKDSVVVAASVTSTTTTTTCATAVSTATRTVTSLQSSTEETVNAYKVALVADVLGSAAQEALKAAGVSV